MSEAGILHVGQLVADRYQVEALLGVGGLAEVYKVRHAELGSVYALKLLVLRRKSYDERLKLEGQIQANLRHPNVVAVMDILRVDGQIGLLMEFVNGTSLDRVLHERGKLGLDEALAIFVPVLAALSWAHDAGALHRDLKPGNVLLADTPVGWVPKVADFGIGKVLDEPTTDPTIGGGTTKTRIGVAMGTPGYMAPEQVRDSSTVDRRADVFSLGALLYEMLTGRCPFLNPDGSLDLTSTLLREPPPLRTLAPAVPDYVEAAITKALAKEPDQRFPDVRAFVAALGLSGNPLFLEGRTAGDLGVGAIRSLSSVPPPSPPTTPFTAAEVVAPSVPSIASAPAPAAVPAAPMPKSGLLVMAAVPVMSVIAGAAVIVALVMFGVMMWGKAPSGSEGPGGAPDPIAARPAPPADPAPAAPAPADAPPAPGVPPVPPAPPPPADPAPAAPSPADPAPAAPSPAAPSPTPSPAAPAPAAPAPAEPAAPAPVPVSVAPAPVPAPAAPAPRIDVAGRYTGKAQGRQMDLVLTADGTRATGTMTFLVGTTRRVEQLEGTADPATGDVHLTGSGGKLRLDGRAAGDTLNGTYAADGGRPVPFSVSR